MNSAFKSASYLTLRMNEDEIFSYGEFKSRIIQYKFYFYYEWLSEIFIERK